LATACATVRIGAYAAVFCSRTRASSNLGLLACILDAPMSGLSESAGPELAAGGLLKIGALPETPGGTTLSLRTQRPNTCTPTPISAATGRASPTTRIGVDP